MWKPGQLITINNKVYRICHEQRIGVCDKCAFKLFGSCALPICDKIDGKYMMYSYFKQVYPKT